MVEDNELINALVPGHYRATYLIAGVPVMFSTIYKLVHQMCAAYRTDREPEIAVVTSKEDIEAELRIERDADKGICIGAQRLESLLVYRLLSLKLMDMGIILMHGSCISVDGEAYLFTALSGTGKSTHVRLWRELLGDRAVMVNDDKPLITVTGDRAIVHGTPWDGKHHLSNNISVPLKAIVYLQRGEENEIERVDAKQLFPILIQQTFRSQDPLVTAKVMQLLAELSKKVEFYSLHCNMDPDAAQVAYDGMNSK